MRKCRTRSSLWSWRTTATTSFDGDKPFGVPVDHQLLDMEQRPPVDELQALDRKVGPAENDGLGYPVWQISNHIFTYIHSEFDCNFDDLPGPQSSLRWRQQGMGARSLVEPPESHCLSLKLQWVLQPLGSKH